MTMCRWKGRYLGKESSGGDCLLRRGAHDDLGECIDQGHVSPSLYDIKSYGSGSNGSFNLPFDSINFRFASIHTLG
jgi:hypothetical protein